MKKKNIYTAGILSLAMIGTFMMPVDAANTTVNYTEASDYVLNIPTTVTVQKSSVTTFKIGATSVNTNPSQKVVVKATGGITSGKVTLTRSGGTASTIQVTVSKTSGGTGITTSDSLAEFQDQSTTATSGGTIYFAAVGSANAGSYSGTITFTGSLANR